MVIKKNKTEAAIKKAKVIKKAKTTLHPRAATTVKPKKIKVTKAAKHNVKINKAYVLKPKVHKVKVAEEPIKPATRQAPIQPAVSKPAILPSHAPVSKEPHVTLKPQHPPVAKVPSAPLVKEGKPAQTIKEPPVIAAPLKKEEVKIIEIDIPIALKDLAVCLQEKPASLIKKLLVERKIIANLNQSIDENLVKEIASEYGYQIKRKPTEEELLFKEHEADDPSKLKSRPPIVTFMGHVDHGKTSLLDAIRKAKVAESEYGGITQHMGAYEVSLPKGKITFLDTPGHEAFTAMRARGAKVTDIVVLVVAADDGVMPQTIEAIDHAKVAGVPIVVAMNKIDKPQANPDTVKKQLAGLGFAPEDWGGKTITVGVSAKTGEGIDELLEMILLEAEMLELKADPNKLASGIVLETRISEGRGTVATLLVENGTLHVQDFIIVGPYYAKIRAMFNEFGKQTSEAPPSCPVEILGLSGLPEAGEQFFALSDEKKAKELAAKRKDTLREKELKPLKMMTLEDFSGQIKEGKVKELRLILKADVAGSLEAINESLKKFEISEVKLNILHQGVGSINVSDVVLAEASGAIILGFHVTCDERSKEEADKSGVDIRTYNVIYELVNDLKTALEGLLEPKLKKIFLGRIQVRQVFKLTKAGLVAGCYVEKGKITRSSKVSLLRNGEQVYEGTVSSLKRFKDDVREVAEGMECGVSLSGFDNVMQGDIIEAYEIEKIARKL